MAPKKKKQQQQQQQQQQKSTSKSKPQSSGSKQAPKLQISEENERRLRHLLLNTERPAAAPPGFSASAVNNLSRAQKAKKLRNLYDKLSQEGFTAEQIEQALSALNDDVAFESALDWLCFNIPGNELPLKFSRGASSASHEGAERTVRIISTAQDDWVPSRCPSDKVKEEMLGISIRKKKDLEGSLDLGKSMQADWIRQYMEYQEQQEEQEQLEQQQQQKDVDVDCCEASIVKEYHLARLAALDAKKQKDHKKQEHFGGIIRKLRQQMAALGLSDEILASHVPEDISCNLRTSETLESSIDDAGRVPDFSMYKNEHEDNHEWEECEIEDPNSKISSLNVPVSEKIAEELEGPVDLELDNLFSEQAASSDILPPDILKPQKKEKSSRFGYGSLVGNINALWRKGNSAMIPKAALQKLCQRLGWEAPKYNKLLENENRFLYAVSILRTATGRGKSRKAGGLITIQLPDREKMCTSAEDAQNKVAAFALCCLFSDIPMHQLLTEPYASLVKRWNEEEFLNEGHDDDETRRMDFVDSLLNLKNSELIAPADSNQVSFHGKLEESHSFESYSPHRKVQNSLLPGLNQHKEAESRLLNQELEKKKKMPRYMEMLQTRSSLPISHLKNQLLQLLRENDVVVICGETGCGKTTQVPQFILDDMIELGLGGYCNIICTQPRRIAAISVAERVSEERCEPPPGFHGSLVGFQVRLESSRTEWTKLLFCTTGILLRRLAGDKDLEGVTHVIVDEVHERSLLGDFLLIVLKNLVERRSATGSKLKVILMSATLDSNLYLRYFNNCPIITAKGRTHPVTTDFLEDIYEKVNYSLPSDSPASGRIIMSARGKLGNSSVDSRRGKKNLVLSSWGDESILSEDYINPCYDANAYEAYSEKTHQNLKKLNEDIIDYDLLEDLICFIDGKYPAGAILVFLPGVAEIDLLVDKLIATYQFGGSSSDWVLPLHSSLASVDQRKVFLSPPESIRKVIVATDIAETSITIDDVIYVVDTGKHKEKRYNPQKKMSSMVEDWISQANAKQRRGRAGRVKPGICFCFYTRQRFESSLRLFQVPEILRMPLTELCLQIKSLSLGDIKSFLSKAIEPPGEDAITSAISLLYEIGAIEGKEELTPLGFHLAKLPVDVLIGKMMLYGAIFGCLSPILSITAFLSYKPPFLYAKDEKQNVERAKTMLMSEILGGGADSSAGNRQSDHLLLVTAYNKWSRILNENGPKAAQQFCRSYFLSSSVMYMIRDMRVQFGNLLADIGLINLPSVSLCTGGKRKDKFDNWFADMSQPFNTYSHHSSIVRSILCAGLYPNVAASTEGIIRTSIVSNRTPVSDLAAKDHPFWCDGKREVHIHPSSVNFNLKKFHYPFLVFLEKVETNRIYLRDTTIVSPYSILLFGGSISVQHQTGLVIIDGWLKLTAPAQVAVLFKELRVTLHAVLKELIRKPKMTTVVKNEVVKSIVQLLLDEDKPCNT